MHIRLQLSWSPCLKSSPSFSSPRRPLMPVRTSVGASALVHLYTAACFHHHHRSSVSAETLSCVDRKHCRQFIIFVLLKPILLCCCCAPLRRRRHRQTSRAKPPPPPPIAIISFHNRVSEFEICGGAAAAAASEGMVDTFEKSNVRNLSLFINYIIGWL